MGGLPEQDVAQVRTNTPSHGTVQMAYARLEALRVIRRQQGKGVFVTDPKSWMREP
ncbi:hypothetical protein ABZ724_08555 [Micromonospora lupini]